MSQKLIQRIEPCRFCGTMDAVILAEVDYWDLQRTNLVQCSNCHLSQLDPMLTDKNQDIGCEAYYRKERFEISEKEQKRNLVRNFRRGVAFGYSLKSKGFLPQKILEFGPGSGYFLEGIKFVFPNVKITVVDIVQAVLDFNYKEHGYETIKSLADDFDKINDKYDLIIARDIIEHVGNIDKMIKNIKNILRVGGLFHFITPNGHEDYWGHKMCHDILNEKSELLINHVNYFDGQSLKEFLQKSKLYPVQYYTYQFKNFIKGKGWKKSLTWTNKSIKKNASNMINMNLSTEKPLPPKEKLFEEEWYISKKYPVLTAIYCQLKHTFLIKMDPKIKYGHEIFGLFRKSQD